MEEVFIKCMYEKRGGGLHLGYYYQCIRMPAQLPFLAQAIPRLEIMEEQLADVVLNPVDDMIYEINVELHRIMIN